MIVDYLPAPLPCAPNESPASASISGDNFDVPPLNQPTDSEFSRSNIDLPVYTQRIPSPTRSQTEHIYTLETNHGQKWLTLKFASRAPSSRSLPCFIEGDTITGQVEMKLEKPERIKAVIVYFKGSVNCSRADSTTFFSLSQELLGDPDDYTSSRRRNSSAKIHGSFLWPFSFKLDREIRVEPKLAETLQLSAVEALPPHLGGKGAHTSIDYQVCVKVMRGGIFSTTSLLYTMIAYTPIIAPERPSLLRQQAYLDGTPLPGPEIDPSGWKIFPDIEMIGTIFKARKISVFCSFALATPLTYTRSSVIPCFLTLKSSDTQAQDLLSDSTAPIVQMRRKLKFRMGVDTFGNEPPASLPGMDENIPLSRAVWAHSQETTLEDGSRARTMYGELNLPGNLTPSFKFGEFEVKYMVDMYTFAISGFLPAAKNQRLLRTEVKIASAFAGGPKPKVYLPPGYVNQREKAASRRLQGETVSGLWTPGTSRS